MGWSQGNTGGCHVGGGHHDHPPHGAKQERWQALVGTAASAATPTARTQVRTDFIGGSPLSGFGWAGGSPGGQAPRELAELAEQDLVADGDLVILLEKLAQVGVRLR